MRGVWIMAAGAALGVWLAGCKATVPEGVYACTRPADCPSGFGYCRQGDDGDGLYCYRSDGAGNRSGAGGSAGRGGTGDAGPGSDAGGAGGGGAGGGGGGDGGVPMAGADGGAPPAPVAPTATGFSSLGGVRSGGGLRLYDERFERGERRCTADARLCVTGGFEP